MGRIERSAARCFDEFFDATENLEPEIQVGEKGKITDGFVYVYSSSPNAQSDYSLKDGSLIGRLPVQVKGKLVSKTGVPPRSFNLKRHELENMAKVGGVVLLVAGLPRSNSGKPTLFYADLGSDNVKYELAQMASTQASRSVRLTELPADPGEVVSLFAHLQKRFNLTSVIKPNTALMSRVEGITVSTPREVDFSRPQFFGGPGSSAIIAVNLQGGETQVIDSILQLTPEEYGLVRNEDLTVSCGTVAFNDTRRRRRTDDRVEFHVSPGIRFVLDREGKSSWHLRFQNRLYYAAKDVAFIENLREGLPVCFNGVEAFQFSGGGAELKEFMRASQYLEDLNKLCSHFSIDPKLFPIASFPEASFDELHTLVLHLFYGGEIQIDSDNPVRKCIELSGKSIQLVWTNFGGVWEVHSLFDVSKMTIAGMLNDAEDEKRKYEQVTAFELFDASELSSILNLCPDQVVEGYSKIGDDRAVQLAGYTVLKLITAADEAPERRLELLGIAGKLSKWVLQNNGDDIFANLNDLQIKYRLGKLSDLDRDFLEATWRQARQQAFGDDSLTVELETIILLGKSDGVNYLLGQMTPEDRRAQEKSPVMYLRDVTGAYLSTEPNNASEWQSIEDEIEREMMQEIVRYSLGKPTSYEQN